MNEESIKRIIDMLQEGINQTSEQLGVALPHLWEVLVRQQVISGISWLVVGVIILVPTWIISLVFFKRIMKWAGEDASNGYNDGGKYAVVFFTYLIVGIITISFLVGLPYVITHIFNPEYHALKEIMDTIKGGI